MSAEIIVADVRDGMATLADQSVQCVVTSPPYWALRDYGVDGQIGLEPTPAEYVAALVAVFREVRRVLRDDGTVWLNLGDSYAGSGPSGASYQSETTKRRAEMASDGSFRISKTLSDRGLTYADKKPIPPPGLKPKDLIGIPWRVAFALQADGWYLRSDIIWAKPNPMPESVTDRPTRSHEYVFLLTKRARYYYDAAAIAEPQSASSLARYDYGFNKVGKGLFENGASHSKGNGADGGTLTPNPGGRNKRSVWQIATQPYAEAHFATFPEALVEPCVLAGSREGDTILDPFAGSGTVGVVALRHNRRFVGIELNYEYAKMARRRITGDAPLLNKTTLIGGAA